MTAAIAMKWLFGPIGKWVMIALALAVWTMGNRIDAARKAEAGVNTSVLQARIEAQQKQIASAEKLQHEAKNRADTTAAQLADVERKKNELIAKVADLNCALPDDVRNLLRSIQ